MKTTWPHKAHSTPIKKNKMKKIALLLAVAGTLSGCSIYKNYQRPSDITVEEVYGEIGSTDSVSIAQLPWRTLFTDSRLQELIERSLEQNTDLRIARLRIDQAQATLTASRLAFLPSFSFAPQGTISSFDGAKPDKSFTLPVAASWQLDVFGSLRNAKQRARTLVESSKVYRQAVQTQLVASIADHYYTLAMLNEQLAVSLQTVDVWKETVRAMRAFMEAGQYNEAAVSQAEASYNRVTASVLELEQQVREEENAISILLGEPIHAIESGKLDSWHTPETVSIGIPLSLLSARPDVMQAELNLATAFYATNEARAAFYPAITLSGTAGWTNLAGTIVNPGKLLLNAVGSLTQPIFQNGRLRAQLKISKSQQEEARLNFQQTLLDAGMEVNNALTQVLTYHSTAEQYAHEVQALEQAVRATRLLMENGSSNYLEVLTAQESLLSARLTLLQNRYREIASFISLYQALGGGRD